MFLTQCVWFLMQIPWQYSKSTLLGIVCVHQSVKKLHAINILHKFQFKIFINYVIIATIIVIESIAWINIKSLREFMNIMRTPFINSDKHSQLKTSTYCNGYRYLCSPEHYPMLKWIPFLTRTVWLWHFYHTHFLRIILNW